MDSQPFGRFTHCQVVWGARHTSRLTGFLATVKSLLRIRANYGNVPAMTDTMLDLRDHREATAARVKATLRALRSHFRVSDQALATLTGTKRATINSWISGDTKNTAESIGLFAWAFQVPEYVILLGPDEAVRWVIDHPMLTGERRIPLPAWVTGADEGFVWPMGDLLDRADELPIAA